MGNPFLLAGLVILATALVALIVFGGDGTVAGLASGDFAQVAQLAAVGVLVASGLVLGRGRLSPRLWHAAVWLALLAALVAGYQAFGTG